MANAFRMSTAAARQLGLIDDAAHQAISDEIDRSVVAALVKPSAEDLFAEQLRFHVTRGLKMARQLHFAKSALDRQWRFDFAFPDYHLAVEIDGVCVRRIGDQLVVGGRHGTITGIRGDNEKLNAATLLGWGVLRFFQTEVKPRHAIDTTLRVLAARGWRAP